MEESQEATASIAEGTRGEEEARPERQQPKDLGPSAGAQLCQGACQGPAPSPPHLLPFLLSLPSLPPFLPMPPLLQTRKHSIVSVGKKDLGHWSGQQAWLWALRQRQEPRSQVLSAFTQAVPSAWHTLPIS